MKQTAGDFFGADGTLTDTDRIVLRAPVRSDLASYIGTFAPGLRDAYLEEGEKGQELREGYWSDVMSEGSLFCTIVDDACHERAGFCCIEDLADEDPEIGVRLLPEWRGRGVGADAVRALMRGVERVSGPQAFVAKIDSGNVASQRLFSGLGFAPVGVDAPIFSDPSLLALIEENSLGLIDDRLRALAKELGVEPRTLLSHALVFRREPDARGTDGPVRRH
ncbi:GNAT family N-acetyltransferase [Olsenella porci]|nr:GNAT family N-acetyltransferase [Olsenella porci]